MAIVYFDSSALVKLMLEETDTDRAVDLWDGCDAALSSTLSYPEVCSALAAAHRDHRLSGPRLRTALAEWDGYWSDLRLIELTSAVTQHAGELVAVHLLSGADGVQLASALAFADADLVVASWDRRLAAGASAEGLRTVPSAA
jgi:uncharacterized protein